MARTVELVDADMAQGWLTTSTPRGEVRKRLVDRYARDMANDRWFVREGDPIAFDESDQLVNGRHRLLAVIASGKRVKMTVMRNG